MQPIAQYLEMYIESFFKGHYPVRTTMVVKGLAISARVEIECEPLQVFRSGSMLWRVFAWRLSNCIERFQLN